MLEPQDLRAGPERLPSEKHISAVGNWEPYCHMEVLRGCSNCQAPHPLARKPPLYQDTCPECGTPSSTPEHREAKAQGNIWLAIANGLQWIANALFRLSQRL